MPIVAAIVINNAIREYDREYHYAVPEALINGVVPGVRVLVPFGKGNKSREGFVLKVLQSSEFGELKEIVRVVDNTPVINEQLIELAYWMRERYICTFSDAVKCMLPAGIGIKASVTVRLLPLSTGTGGKADFSGYTGKEQAVLGLIEEAGGERDYEDLRVKIGIKDFSKVIKSLTSKKAIDTYEEYTTRVREKSIRAAYLSISRDEAVEEIESGRIRRIQHIRVLEILMDNEYISVSDLLRFSGVSGSVLDTLKKYGFIDFRDIEVNRDPVRNRVFPPTSPLLPTAEQQYVLDRVKSVLDTGGCEEILLHGVTGSGKTEVYLQLIRHVIDKGRGAIVLVPEISLTPQMVERFKGRFGNNVAVLHSRLSLGERYDQWRLIRDGKIKVVVGARSAVFAPLSSPGIVIIDEEHENSYKSEITPKYNAAEIGRKRCMESGAVLLLGSATPSVETYYRAKTGKIALLEMTNRTNNMQMPSVSLVDMRRELEEGNRSVFSRLLEKEISKNLQEEQQTILFLNRRGYASFVLCRSCGHTIKCENCNVSMTYHSTDERLICHYCGFTVKSPSVCPRCGSRHIRHFGSGTQKVEDDIKKQFEGCSVIRMDMDSTTGRNSHEEILRAFKEDNINILVGTQMIAKGHDFPNVTLVGVLAADSLLNSGDYRAAERTFQLLTQVSGRAGRGEKPGRVVIQTYNTEDFSILAACSHDYAAFFKQEITVREKLGYPPFKDIAVLILSGTNDRQVFAAAKELKARLSGRFPIEGSEPPVLGPARAPLSKIKNKYRWRIIIKSSGMDKLISVLSDASDTFSRQNAGGSVDLSMDINPFNML